MENYVDQKRREFLTFMGLQLGLGVWAGLGLSSCVSAPVTEEKISSNSLFIPLPPSSQDDLVLADGLKSQVLIQWGDQLNSKQKFGFNNDFLAYFPLTKENPNEGILWANHEYVMPMLVSGFSSKNGQAKTKSQCDIEMQNLGGSLVHIRRKENAWEVVSQSKYNRRLDAQTRIPLITSLPIQGSRTAIGTFANCAGGVTPWGTVLTCEENFQDYYGEAEYKKTQEAVWGRKILPAHSEFGWTAHYNYPPEHYGWVVEVNPKTGEAKKLTSLGRFSHEGATCVKAKDGRTVVYMGDDKADQYFYKFISEKPGSLEKGTLYVAHLESGRWLPLDIKKEKILEDNFENQTQVLVLARQAAKILGATPMDRPEDCEIDPATGAIYVNLTMNKAAGRPFGSILKIVERESDYLSLEFTPSVFKNGGPETGFACPDNMIFDRKGNLWITSDIGDQDLNNGIYKEYGNNSLFFIPMSGPESGKVMRIAVAPIGAELTGPWFSPDGKSLFLSVQHPGGNSSSMDSLTSHWPRGGTEIPRPSVVVISGPLLDKLLS